MARAANPLASAGGFQVVQKNDDGQRHRHGAQDVREPGPAAAQPQKHGSDAASAAAHQKSSGNFRAIPRVARRASPQARLPVSFQPAGGKTGNGNSDFQLAGQIGSRRISQRHFHLRRRGNLRAGIAALLRPLSHARQTRGGRRRIISAV